MKRWNGWGEESTTYPLPEAAARYLTTLVGDGVTAPDASFEQALAAVPTAHLPAHPLISSDPIDRLRHSRGHSLPDWVAMRSGRIGTFPDGVAFPSSEAEVRALLDFAAAAGVCLIPYGGGTSVVGHINPQPGRKPLLTLDLGRLNRLLALDETSRLATLEAGVRGPDLESLLQARGYTLGHYPQSFELSTLGGWIATRSSGQQSYHYGRIEDHFAGGHLETPLGPLDLPPLPASAAGPDVRQFVLGSEGRLGIITRAVVRVRPIPEAEGFYGAFFHDWDSGAAAVRAIVQNDVPVSMLRLSDAQETETTLALSGKERLVRWADRGLRTLGYSSSRSLLIYGITGTRSASGSARRSAEAIIRQYAGLPTGQTIGRIWRKSRFLTPYLRNTLWERGYALDTVETAVPWSAVVATATAVKSAIHGALSEAGERVLVFAHLSHVYRDGASVYTTFLFRPSLDPDETVQRWQILKAAATRQILAHGGTISHQHGVGLDHRQYLSAEKGAVGMAWIAAVCRAADAGRILNPGKLLADE